MSSGRKSTPFDAHGAGSHGTATSPSVQASLEAARLRLGGRPGSPSLGAPGSFVEAKLRDGMSHAAVLLWSSHDRCDVWCEDGKAWRSRADAVTPRTGPVPETLVRVAGEIRVFSTIAEGQRVRWVRGTLVVEGHVAEKCRYGALVITSSGRLMAVGFRMLWPAVVCSVA